MASGPVVDKDKHLLGAQAVALEMDVWGIQWRSWAGAEEDVYW